MRKIAWFLTLLCMAFIFYMSSRSIEVSRSDSARFMAVFGLVEQEEDAMEVSNREMMQLQNMVRKNAHLIIYAGLGALYFVSVYGYFGGIRVSGAIATLLTAFYGATDEFHQIFTHRGAARGDVLIDMLGGLAGILLAGIIFLVIEMNIKLRAFFSRVYDFEPRRHYGRNQLKGTH